VLPLEQHSLPGASSHAPEPESSTSAPTHAASVPLPASAFGLQWCVGGAARFGETLRNEDNALRSRAFRFNLEPATRWLRARCRGCSPTT
jgi:hypothetical protein